jgi:aromatic ring-opening dioxygenase LigB subunit
MLIFASFVPHSPLLVQTVGKEHAKEAGRTLAALHTLADRLEASRPDLIIILSAHQTSQPKSFSGNVSETYRAHLETFGDMGTQKIFMPDLAFVDGLQRHLRKQDIPFVLQTSKDLDHGASVPLLLLTKSWSCPILPITYASSLSMQAHRQFGYALKDHVMSSPKRVAVIASGDLSHALRTQSPEGYHPEGEHFDSIVQEAVAHHSITKLLTLKKEEVANAQQCAYRPLLMLFGLLERVRTSPEILCYESPFGVGFLTADFHLA